LRNRPLAVARMRLCYIAFRPQVGLKAGRKKTEGFKMKGGDTMEATNGAKLMKLYESLEKMIASAKDAVENAGDHRTRVIFQARLEALEDVHHLLRQLIWD